MRPVLVGALLLLEAALVPALAQPRPGVEQTPQLFILRLSGSFDDVMTSLQEAIKRRNYVVTGVNNLDDTLARRSRDVGGPPLPWTRYKVVGFCNLTLADEALRHDPSVGAFMPCRAVVYEEPGTREITIIAFRPSFVGQGFGERMAGLMRQVEADILAILAEVAAD
jgi:uncharacterized protein (DUF302 family)